MSVINAPNGSSPTNFFDWVVTVCLSVWGVIVAAIEPGALITTLTVTLLILKIIHEIVGIRRTAKMKNDNERGH